MPETHEMCLRNAVVGRLSHRFVMTTEPITNSGTNGVCSLERVGEEWGPARVTGATSPFANLLSQITVHLVRWSLLHPSHSASTMTIFGIGILQGVQIVIFYDKNQKLVIFWSHLSFNFWGKKWQTRFGIFGHFFDPSSVCHFLVIFLEKWSKSCHIWSFFRKFSHLCQFTPQAFLTFQSACSHLWRPFSDVVGLAALFLSLFQLPIRWLTVANKSIFENIFYSIFPNSKNIC